MSELATLSPGPVLGRYPEREDERLSALDRAMAGAAGWLRQRLSRRVLHDPAFLKRVRWNEQRLSDLPPGELPGRVAHLRQALRRDGFAPDLVAASFALIRLTAARILGLTPFDVQLMGGLAMLRGAVAEMDTGEGKTLTATLPAATAALGGAPVHVITVNDYLAARDADWMRPLYAALGLSVGTILEGMDPESRRRAYGCDVVYGSNKQIAFDYLRDRIALGAETRALHLRLEALTGSTGGRAQPGRGVLMRGLCFGIVDEADGCLIDEARTPLLISRPGRGAETAALYETAVAVARALDSPRDYVIEGADRHIRLTDLGKARLRRLTAGKGGVWAAQTPREGLARQALTALHLYERDRHYILREGRVAIVDEYTGRTMADRSWERGLHQMIEVKEGVAVTGLHETVARISYQRFFRRYLHLCGMTGTAREVAGELWSVYGLGVRRIRPNRPSRRRDLGLTLYRDEAAKWRAVAARTAVLHAQGRPVLIGTRSVAASEALSAVLSDAGLPHAVLNARQDAEEAAVIAQAGLAGRITVATNMAGRGADIALGPGVAARGGLAVIATEPHDSRRIDRQLAGRCGRQGDPGSHETVASLTDEVVRDAFGSRPDRLAALMQGRGGRLPALPFRWLVRLAQNRAEARTASQRRQLARHDDGLEDMMAFAGRAE
jgi:preprotein translocase subunit SecA